VQEQFPDMVNELLLRFLKDHPVAWQMFSASHVVDLRSIIYSHVMKLLFAFSVKDMWWLVCVFSEGYVMSGNAFSVKDMWCLVMRFQWKIHNGWYCFEYVRQLCLNYVILPSSLHCYIYQQHVGCWSFKSPDCLEPPQITDFLHKLMFAMKFMWNSYNSRPLPQHWRLQKTCQISNRSSFKVQHAKQISVDQASASSSSTNNSLHRSCEIKYSDYNRWIASSTHKHH
jgi:hypothetical protein